MLQHLDTMHVMISRIAVFVNLFGQVPVVAKLLSLLAAAL